MGIRWFEWLSYQVAMELKQDIEQIGCTERRDYVSVYNRTSLARRR